MACAGADPAVFGPVYDALAPFAFGVSLGVLPDPNHAAEVTQDVMVEVWQTAAQFDPARTSASTWVAMIARQRAVDRVRAERSWQDMNQPKLDATVADVAHAYAAEKLERRPEGESVRRCFDSLAPTQRAAIVEAYYGGLTYREIAEHLDAGLPTITAHIRDGLGRLRESLGLSRG
ncbi:RNA polymerase sigma-70 factor, ECF subfamily [Promicromonospora umidemergens]|uniref:Sigma-70 family RNA polymerase sigma factor n=1 Tax=Promicromonospora umidemergens TaxID=629679 RepID=A0ABP8X2H7_9MICO|nr:sigma-70 family RNA polymerase sigma factor [Promicromonospora umidemergens]MCP2285554.1 RNA polymerase sigma-70 factor, ECF subfamily [Promicromonospora umidemergens]